MVCVYLEISLLKHSLGKGNTEVGSCRVYQLLLFFLLFYNDSPTDNRSWEPPAWPHWDPSVVRTCSTSIMSTWIHSQRLMASPSICSTSLTGQNISRWQSLPVVLSWDTVSISLWVCWFYSSPVLPSAVLYEPPALNHPAWFSSYLRCSCPYKWAGRWWRNWWNLFQIPIKAVCS